MPLNAAIVLTTIAEPVVLDEYRANLQSCGHLDQVTVYVIPDRKTPSEAFERCQQLQRQGLKVVFPDFEAQDAFLRKVGFPPALVPYNSDNRRNIGYLMALGGDHDFLISIDDDNYSGTAGDYFAEHSVVCGERAEVCCVNSDSGWFNICDLMEMQPAGNAYARGFPYFAKHKTPAVTETLDLSTVRMNAGLWLSEPDMDGISWLVNPVKALSFRGKSVVLGPHTWSPINTQNTALERSVIASYYFVRMGYPLNGLPIDRYGDIFSGYFSQACVRHLGHSVRVGTPVADHRRNSHNYLRDATNEMFCIWLLEDLLQWLPSQALDGNTYAETYTSLSHLLEEAVFQFQGFIWNDASRAYFSQMAFCMRKWAEVCRKIEGA